MNDQFEPSSPAPPADADNPPDITAPGRVQPHPRRTVNMAARLVISGLVAAPLFFVIANFAYRDLPPDFLVLGVVCVWLVLTGLNTPATADYGRSKPGDSPADRGVWSMAASFAVMPALTWPVADGGNWTLLTAVFGVAMASLYATRYSVNLAFGAMIAGGLFSVPVLLYADRLLMLTVQR